MIAKFIQYEPTERDKTAKCSEVVRNIKALADGDAEHMKRYLDIKCAMMAFYFSRDDKGLQECWKFMAKEIK